MKTEEFKDLIRPIVYKYGSGWLLDNPEMLEEICKKYHSEQLLIQRVVSSSNMRKALETVVRGYEGDGMENMQIRDEVFYKTCKEALTFDDSTKD